MTTHDLLWQERIARYRKQRALLDPLGITVPRGKLIPLLQVRAARIRRLPLIALGLALAVGLAWRFV